MTRFEHVNRYAASTDEVLAMLTDPAFRERVCEAQRAVEHSVHVTEGGVGPAPAQGVDSGTVVEVIRTQSMQGAPAVATKAVGTSISLVQRETWTSADTAQLEVHVPGKPVHVRGSIRLRPTSEGCEEVLTGEVKVKVPLVGGKLEGFVVQILTKAMVREGQVGQEWLAGSP